MVAEHRSDPLRGGATADGIDGYHPRLPGSMNSSGPKPESTYRPWRYQVLVKPETYSPDGRRVPPPPAAPLDSSPSTGSVLQSTPQGTAFTAAYELTQQAIRTAALPEPLEAVTGAVVRSAFRAC